MYVATRANVRTTFQAYKFFKKSQETKENTDANSLIHSFDVTFRVGCVMGFILVSLALAFLIIIFKSIQDPKTIEDFLNLFKNIVGYGLGESTVALFCRVGGGIYTKAADVGADLVGKNL